MGISLWELSSYLVNGGFFIAGLMVLRNAVKTNAKWKRLKRQCTQQTLGVVEMEKYDGGRQGVGQIVSFAYDVKGEHFFQTLSRGYKQNTFQWGQQVTVHYDPIAPENCYLEGDGKVIHHNAIKEILFSIFLCLFSGLGIISQIL